MIENTLISFLKDLSKNNNRDWFHNNKKRYEADLKKPFEQFIQAVIDSMQEISPDIQIQPKEAIFRIHRDTRFSKDKTPYKTHVSALISKFGRKAKEFPGFYFHLEPGRLMLGGGAYYLEKDTLAALRHHITNNLERFEEIVTKEDFIGKYETLKGEQHKRIPKEFKETFEKLPLIANKQFYYMAELSPDKALEENFLDVVKDYFNTGKPINDFIAEVMN